MSQDRPTCCCSYVMDEPVLFAGLEDSLRKSIQDDIENFTVQPGEFVYRINDPGMAAFSLRTGVVKLVQYLPDGTHRIVRLTRPSDE